MRGPQCENMVYAPWVSRHSGPSPCARMTEKMTTTTEAPTDAILKKDRPPLSLHIVVARFQESLDWIPESWRPDLWVYDKSSVAPVSAERHLPLPNVGREAHTYLHHILTHWDNLPDILVLTQAYPFDHAPNFVSQVDAIRAASIVNTGEEMLDYYTDCGFSMHTIRKGVHWSHGHIQQEMDTIHNMLFASEWPAQFDFSAGAILAVSKKRIRQWPRSMYEKCMSTVDKEINPAGAYVMERLWPLLWNPAYDSLECKVSGDEGLLEGGLIAP